MKWFKNYQNSREMVQNSDKVVLLVGVNGLLGSTLSKYLQPYYKVYKGSLTDSTENDFNIDITNREEVDSIVKQYNPDYIINCSAYTNVDDCEDSRGLAYDINVGGVKNLIFSSSLHTKIIHISTDYVFDGSKNIYNENDIPNPVNYYGKTKLEAENLLRSANRKYIIFRTSVIYNNMDSSFYSWVLSELKSNKVINVVDDQISNPTWTWSLSEAICKSMISNLEGLFHFGGDDVLSRYDFAVKIATAHNLDVDKINRIKTKDLKQKAKRPLNTTLESEKIKTMIEIEHPSLEIVLNTFING